MGQSAADQPVNVRDRSGGRALHDDALVSGVSEKIEFLVSALAFAPAHSVCAPSSGIHFSAIKSEKYYRTLKLSLFEYQKKVRV
jgi:hypothetical protein